MPIISRREFLRFTPVIPAAILAACGPAIPTPPPTTKPEGVTPVVKEIPTSTPVSREREWSPGQSREEMSMGLVGPDKEGSIVGLTVETVNYTDIKFRWNENTFQNLVNLFHQHDGILPRETKIWIVENDLEEPEVPATTNIEQNTIVLSLGRVLKSKYREDYTPEGYGVDDIIDGLLAGQLGYLMFSKSQNVDLGRGADTLQIPQTPENKQWVGERCGVMVAAIRAGKEYQEYTNDAVNIFCHAGNKFCHGKKEPLFFDSATYLRFQKAFQEPLLIFFEQTPIFSPPLNL